MSGGMRVKLHMPRGHGPEEVLDCAASLESMVVLVDVGTTVLLPPALMVELPDGNVYLVDLGREIVVPRDACLRVVIDRPKAMDVGGRSTPTPPSPDPEPPDPPE